MSVAAECLRIAQCASIGAVIGDLIIEGPTYERGALLAGLSAFVVLTEWAIGRRRETPKFDRP